jgi:hypothetical protein
MLSNDISGDSVEGGVQTSPLQSNSQGADSIREQRSDRGKIYRTDEYEKENAPQNDAKPNNDGSIHSFAASCNASKYFTRLNSSDH